jgi:hypothetical protein
MFFAKRISDHLLSYLDSLAATLLTHFTDANNPIRFSFSSGYWRLLRANNLAITSTSGAFTGEDHITVTFSVPSGGQNYNGDRTVKLYINGQYQGQTTTYLYPIRINGISGYATLLPTATTQEIDELKIWSRELSAAEVAAHWNTRLNIASLPPDLTHYYDFDTEGGSNGKYNRVTGTETLVFHNSGADPSFAAETAPIIDLRVDSVKGGANLLTGDTAIQVVGSDLDTITSITIDGEEQTILGGATSSLLTFDLVQTEFAYGTFDMVFSAPDGDITKPVVVAPPANKSLVTIGTYIETGSERIQANPDIAAGDIIRYDTAAGLTIYPSGSVEFTGQAPAITFYWDYFDVSVGIWQDGAQNTITQEPAGPDSPPTAVNLSIGSTAYNQLSTIPVTTILSSCAAGEGGDLTLTSVTPGTNCQSVSIVGPNVVIRPAYNVSGAIQVSYTITESGTGLTATASLNGTISALNMAMAHTRVFQATANARMTVTRTSNNQSGIDTKTVTVT